MIWTMWRSLPKFIRDMFWLGIASFIIFLDYFKN